MANINEVAQLNEHQLHDARASRLREIRIWQAVREITFYIIFISLLFFVTYTNVGTSAFDYRNSMFKTFKLEEVTIQFLTNSNSFKTSNFD